LPEAEPEHRTALPLAEAPCLSSRKAPCPGGRKSRLAKDSDVTPRLIRIAFCAPARLIGVRCGVSAGVAQRVGNLDAVFVQTGNSSRVLTDEPFHPRSPAELGSRRDRARRGAGPPGSPSISA